MPEALRRVNYFQAVMSYDRQKLDEFKATTNKIKQAKKDLVTKKAELETLEDKQTQKLAEIDTAVSDLKNKLGSKIAQIQSSQELQARYEQDLQRQKQYEQELERQKAEEDRKRAEEILDLVKKTEHEITCSDHVVIGDVYIGAGETDGMRLLAKAAGNLKKLYPGIHYHISSGNAVIVKEQLDKGLIDFGIIFGTPDSTKYESLKLPSKDIWGVLMPKDSPLAEKESVSPEDLWDQPLLISQQETECGRISRWMKRRLSELDITMTYNLLFNASLLVEEGLGYAICFDRIINTSGDSKLCFRPLSPTLEIEMYMIWKKYQVFSKPAEKFLWMMQENMYK